MPSHLTDLSPAPVNPFHDGGTVLLIGSSVDKHRLYTALERNSRRVLEAVDVVSAHKVLRRESVDAICASGARGLDMIEHCRAAGANHACILIATPSELPDLVARLAGGPSVATTRIAMDSWSEADLLMCVEDALDAARMRRENAALAGALEESRERLAALTEAGYHPDGPMAAIALTDPLTGLANRMLMLEHLERAIEQAAHRNDHVAVISFGLDRFKLINSGLGQRAGDELLKALAQRLLAETRGSDSIARIGGDEFAFVFSSVSSMPSIGSIAKRISKCLEVPFNLQGREIFTSASMGISIYPQDGVDAGELLRSADEAMQQAKRGGGSRYQFHSARTDEQTRSRLTLEAELRRALSRAEFELYYQPRVEGRDGHITGAEGLLRWRHPERGLVPPGQFIPLLEDTGLIAPVGRWVLEQACTALARWGHLGRSDLSLSVNLSPRQFTLCDLEQDVRGAFAAAGLVAGEAKLELEITESLMLTDYAHSVELLRHFRRHGILIAMDDFGTGYSSLSYLNALPLDVLKIDRSFIAKLGQSRQADALVVAIIAMAHNLNLSIVAEGVETRAQWAFLQAHGAEELQGYLFGEPVTEREFLGALADVEPVIEIPHRRVHAHG